MKQTKHILVTIAMLLCSLAAKAEVSVEVIDIANNADAMLYTNAKCTNTSYGDQFAGWHVLFDNDPSTFFHSEYSNRNSDDGLDHYIRVDLGEDSDVKMFSFTYTVRGTIPYNGNYSPKTMVVEGSNIADGTYTKLATLNNLPSEGAAVYESPAIGNGTSYRYIRFRVTETYYNTKIYGHPFFFMAEFGMMRVRIEGTCGDNLSWKLKGDNELVIEGTGDMYDYSPGTSPWFEYGESIQTITMGESVTSIGESAFAYCRSLTTINIPEGVTSIGDDAFFGCSSLTSITIPENSQLTSIGDHAFRDCSSLTTITIPESVTSIGWGAFYNCSSLTSITIPEGVTSIGDFAFEDCSSLTTITIPENSQLTSIGDHAFEGTAWYNNQPDGVVYVGKVLYEYKGTMPENTSIEVEEGTLSISSYAFEGCNSLTAITIPESVTSIGWYAFDGCSSLTSINIPEGVTSIGGYAFYNCSSLTSITIPENSQLTNIGESAFEDCSSLTAITIPEGVTSIGKDAFSGCSRLERVMINCANVDSWFSGLSSLKEIVLGEGVTSIGDFAFEDCSSLTSITIPESVTSIGGYAFFCCSSLTSITCEATTPPTVGYTFNYVDKSIPVYVPAGSVEAYKAAAYWSEFANFLALPTYVANITFGQSEAMLTEGETVTLTATVTPDDVTDKTLTWSSSDERVATVDAAGLVTALAPGTATITVAANDGSGVSASCVVTVKAKPTVRCAVPVMDYVDGQVVLTCETEGVEFVTDVVAEGAQRYQTSTFDLAAVYTITAYATKEGYLDSDPVTLTLCWVPCTEEHEDDDTDGIITLPAKPVLIQTAGGVITLTDLPEGTEVAVYDTAGTSLAAATAENGTATLTTNLNTGSTAIVKIGGHSVKVVVK